MRMPCDLIQDLLPLYHDEVCSQTSREAVEEHLQDCSTCQKVLDAMGGELLTPEEKEEEKELRPLAEWWKKQKKKNHLNAVVYTIFLVIIVGVGLYFATWYVEIPVSPEKMEVSHVCELSDGRISFNLYIIGGCEFSEWKFDGEGNAYLIPKRMFPAKPDKSGPVRWNYADCFYIPQNEGDTLLPETVTAELPLGTTAVYVGQGDESILVWQEEDVVPRANSEWEALVEQARIGDDKMEYYLAIVED